MPTTIWRPSQLWTLEETISFSTLLLLRCCRRKWLDELAAQPKVSSESLVRRIIATAPGTTGDVSAIAVSEYAKLQTLLDQFVDAAMAIPSRSSNGDTPIWIGLSKAAAGSMSYGYDNTDLYSFMERVPGEVGTLDGSSELVKLSQKIVSALKVGASLVLERTGSPAAHGLSIYLPIQGVSVADEYCDSFMELPWFAGKWHRFLQTLPGPNGGNGVARENVSADWGDSIGTSRLIVAATPRPASIRTAIERNNDVDFFRIDAVAGQVLSSSCVSTDPGLKSKLWLFGPDRKTVIAANDGGSTGVAALNGIALKSTGSYYLAVADRQVASPLAPQGGASTGGYLLDLVVGSPTEMKPTLVLSSASVAFGNVLAQENHRAGRHDHQHRISTVGSPQHLDGSIHRLFCSRYRRADASRGSSEGDVRRQHRTLRGNHRSEVDVIGHLVE